MDEERVRSFRKTRPLIMISKRWRGKNGTTSRITGLRGGLYLYSGFL